MIQITPHQKLLIAVDPVDFRKGIDGLAALCRGQLMTDPFSGALFVFTNRRRSSVKILCYDGLGFWLCTRRFSCGKLAWWPKEPSATFSISTTQLQLLLNQADPTQANLPQAWRRIEPTLFTDQAALRPPSQREANVSR